MNELHKSNLSAHLVVSRLYNQIAIFISTRKNIEQESPFDKHLFLDRVGLFQFVIVRLLVMLL